MTILIVLVFPAQSSANLKKIQGKLFNDAEIIVSATCLQVELNYWTLSVCIYYTNNAS